MQYIKVINYTIYMDTKYLLKDVYRGVTMSNINKMLENLYERNPANGNFIIEVFLNNYDEIFNEWDSSPIKRKDINPELLNFLEDSIDDIPVGENIDLCFYLAKENRNEAKEKTIIGWFKTFYNFYIELEKSKMKVKVRFATILIIVSLLVFTLSYFRGRNNENIFNYLFGEVIVVGGWVFLWEAISVLIFDIGKNRKLIMNYKRFLKSEILFRYNESEKQQII